MTLATFDCSTVETDFGGLCSWTSTYYTAPAAACGVGQYTDSNGNCQNYPSATFKAGMLLGGDATVDAGNTAWLLACTCMTALMVPALGVFNSGLTEATSAGNTILMSVSAMAVVTLQWYLFGYSFAFGPGSESFGSFQWGAFTMVSGNPAGAYGTSIPHVLWAVFQCVVASFGAAIMSGAVVGRMKFSAWLVFVFVWTTIVYDVIAHWLWAKGIDGTTFTPINVGWLINGQHSNMVTLDFGGGIVLMVTSGFSALAAAIVLGPRKMSTATPEPHDIPLVLLGATALWFGWIGLNSGQAGAADGQAGEAFWNVHVAAASGALSYMLTERVTGGRPSPRGASIGAVVGLAAATSGSGFITNWGAVIVGWVAPPIAFAVAKLRSKLGPDDTLDVFSIFGVSGVVGAFCTGIFADPGISGVSTALGGSTGYPTQIGVQLAAILMCATYAFCVTFGLMFALKKTIGIRIEEEKELGGIDVSEHGGNAYPKGETN